jgi:hypothetical protein
VTGGVWSFTPTTALGDGVHNLRIYASDDAGNASTTTPVFAITVDATAPATTCGYRRWMMSVRLPDR